MDLRRLKTDLLALCLLALCVFLTLCLWSYDPADPPSRLAFPARTEPLNVLGPYGAFTAHYLRTGLGLGSFFLVFALFTMDMRLFSRNGPTDRLLRAFGILIVVAGTCIGLQLYIPQFGDGPAVGGGGYVGAWGIAFLEPYFTIQGITILAGTVVAAGILIAGDLFLMRFLLAIPLLPFRLLGLLFRRRPQDEKSDVESEAEETPEPDETEDPDDDPEPLKKAPPAGASSRSKPGKPIKVNPPVVAKSLRSEVVERLEAGSGAKRTVRAAVARIARAGRRLSLRNAGGQGADAAAVLEKTFKDFNLNVRVVEIDTGPVVTQFELELEAGLRLSKVAALADDLAVALRVPAVRFVPSIPGKNTVGVEVPNEKQVLVRLRELIEACPDAIDKMRIPLFLGKDVSGRPVVVDLTKMPHLLIAGRTGTGKSVCLNTLILSMLMTRNPDQVKMLLIDPKMVELSPYKRVPHLMHPVITDMKKAEAVLAWAVDKMEERYDLFAQVGVRHFDNYNKLGKEKVLAKLGLDPDSEEAEQIPESMPYIVIIADEMADMMMTSGKDVEGHIIRLAQKSRRSAFTSCWPRKSRRSTSSRG